MYNLFDHPMVAFTMAFVRTRLEPLRERSERGASALETAILAYTGGRANSSYFGKVGKMHAQEGEGTRSAMMFSLFPDPSITLTNTSPINFSLDQAPVGINAGYTWASPYFKQAFGIQARVTNGVNADGPTRTGRISGWTPTTYSGRTVDLHS